MQGTSLFEDRGLTCLFIDHAAGQPKKRATHTFGEGEWPAIVSWIGYAQDHGATRVILVGWSYGALLAVRAAVATAHSSIVAGLLLDSPLLDWPTTIAHSASRYRLPKLLTGAATWSLRLPLVSRLAGLPFSVRISGDDSAHLSRELRVPVLALHGSADLTTPPVVTSTFCAARENRQFESFQDATHGAERYLDPERWDHVVGDWLDHILSQDSPNH